MNKITLVMGLALAGLLGCQTVQNEKHTSITGLTEWKSDASPKKIGLLMAENFMKRPFDF